MNAAIFDSHKYAKRLIDAGVTPQAAGVHAEMLLEVMSQIAGGSASGERMEARLGARTDKVATDLDGKIDHAVAEINAKIDHAVVDLNAKIDHAVVDLNAKIEKVAAESRAYAAEVKADTVRWVVSVALLQFALNSALVLKLIH
ncbi:MAG TPA: hypothetical protein VJ752_05205 [Burkholderiaceae bacterium]|nr:hypothetical protein [Burkholderiaceae bacterium]